MKQLLILLSILLFSSPVNGENHQEETLYVLGEYPDWKWVESGDKKTQSKYQGQVKDGKPNGLGSLTYPDGSKYVGEYKDGKKHGQGTSTWSDGRKYVGEYKDGIPNGKGTHTFGKGDFEGDKYEGEYKGGIPNGQGTYTSSNGEKYEGEWKDEKPWNGTYYDKDGNIKGKFVNGKEIHQ